jgi:DNA helicase II / ATP-dependent DNA helicase PcrA
MNKIKQEYLASWQKAYESLNQKQREAVDTIDGPVMTIAGPGTGKTQLLAVRIGNILMKTDVFPHNILSLTYTDAGAIAMRNRLISFIGPDAYNVGFFTFHAFCNTVIKENPQYFGDLKSLQLVSDIEEVEVLRAVIDGFGDDHPLKRFKGDEYSDMSRLKNLFQTMKQEKWSPNDIKEAYQRHEKNVLDPAVSKFTYKGNRGEFKKGDINPREVNLELKRYEKLLAAVDELDTYKAEMGRRERFDYQDMLLWVLEKFKTHDELLARYQERFQYILVDEYQDTNGAQNELLFLLTSFWEDPNLFIVGDDDQSIFRFQGANMNSIIDFKNKFNPKVIILTENYRSSQKILDTASKLIKNNEDRLANKYPELVKELTESRKEKPLFTAFPEFYEYQNEMQEDVGIIKKIQTLHQSGIPYNQIAIIYTKHSIVENLVKYCSQKKIPINVKNKVNVLYENEVHSLINILEYLNVETTRPHNGEEMLFEILHYAFFVLSPLDIAAVNLHCRRKSEDTAEDESYLKWRTVMSSENLLIKAGVSDIQTWLHVSKIIEQWISDVANVTIQTLIEKILTEGNVLGTILASDDKSWKLQLINTFFDFVKNEAAKVKSLTLKQVINLVEIMKSGNIELPVYRIISNEKGINFLTAHSAKGLEFEHVFIMRATQKNWEDKKGANFNFSLPPTLTASTSGGDLEDERRLFFVALTRAKNYIYISYPLLDNAEKGLPTSRFVAEILASEDEKIKLNPSEDEILEYTAELMKYQKGEVQLIDHDLIDKILQNFRISATSLNKYLRCKLTFYFETILRVPMARSASMGFGNAIHYALEQFFRDIEKSIPRSFGSAGKLLEFYKQGLDLYRSHFTTKEYENYSKYGETILLEYYEKYHTEWLLPRKYELEYNIPLAEYKGVPISGKLDRLNIYDGYVTVTDYKTGRFDTQKLKAPEDKNPEGGDYWRQIMFYRLLLDSDKRNDYHLKKGIMDFIEKDTKGVYQKRDFEITTVDMDTVGDQLVQAYTDIKSHIFSPGCGDDRCRWCNFVIRNMPVQSHSEIEDDSDFDFIENKI